MSCISNAAINPFFSYVVATYSCVFKNAAIDPKPWPRFKRRLNLAIAAFFENVAIGPNPIAVGKKRSLNLGYSRVF